MRKFYQDGLRISTYRSIIQKEFLGNGGVLDTQTLYSIRLYCYGTLGMTREWLLKDNITPAETAVEMMFRSMPEALRRIYFAT